MRYLLCTVLLLSSFSACTAQPAGAEPAGATPEPTATGEPTAEDWLTRVENRATDIKTLSAKLRYDNNQLLLGDKQRRFGTMIYEAGPPPRFNVHFDRKLVDGHWSEPDLYYIYDGRWLLKQDHENKTATRYQLVPDDEEAAGEMELGEGPFPLPLNLKKDKVLSRYTVELVAPAEDDPENSIHLKLTPHEDYETDLTRIDLWFDRDSALPQVVSSLDDSETQTVVKLSDVQVNTELPDETFDTALPNEPGWQTDENRITPKPTD